MNKTKTKIQPGNARTDLFLREVINKEKRLTIDHIRQQAPHSHNPLVRAIHLGEYIDTSGVFEKAPTPVAPKIENFVSDKGGEFLLSRGALPSSVHANYGNVPVSAPSYVGAEQRRVALENELKSIEDALAAKEREMRAKSEMFGSASKGASMQLPSLNVTQSNPIGSTFKFHSLGGRSTFSNDFDWPEITSKTLKLKNTQYGLCTRTCDVPGGNLNIRVGAGKKNRSTKLL